MSEINIRLNARRFDCFGIAIANWSGLAIICIAKTIQRMDDGHILHLQLVNCIDLLY